MRAAADGKTRRKTAVADALGPAHHVRLAAGARATAAGGLAAATVPTTGEAA